MAGGSGAVQTNQYVHLAGTVYAIPAIELRIAAVLTNTAPIGVSRGPGFAEANNIIERLWALMHERLTHNKTYPTCREFADAILAFLRNEVPSRWAEFCDSVTDNFRVILPAKFRILA